MISEIPLIVMETAVGVITTITTIITMVGVMITPITIIMDGEAISKKETTTITMDGAMTIQIQTITTMVGETIIITTITMVGVITSSSPNHSHHHNQETTMVGEVTSKRSLNLLSPITMVGETTTTVAGEMTTVGAIQTQTQILTTIIMVGVTISKEITQITIIRMITMDGGATSTKANPNKDLQAVDGATITMDGDFWIYLTLNILQRISSLIIYNSFYSLD